MNLIEYRNKVVGTLIDYDGVYGSQCVDLIKNYTATVLGERLGTFGGSAKTGWVNASNTFPVDKWLKIHNIPTDKNQIPIAGDIVFYDTGIYGHVAIVLDAYGNGIEVLEQNAGSGDGKGQDDAIKVSALGYRNILGWYRYKKPIGITADTAALLKKNSDLIEENKILKEKLSKINTLSIL